MGARQFHGNQARPDAPGPAGGDRDRFLSRSHLQRSRRQHPVRQRHRVQPVAGGERHRQLRQDRAARPGQDRVRPAARRAARAGNVGGADGQGAMTDQPPRSAGWDCSRSAAGDRNPWLVAVVVSNATFMVVLDTAIANVSLRYIAGSLAASVDESTWVVSTYLIANAVILPASGWLSNVLGRKRFYMICVAVFTVSSLLCGLAPSLSALIFFRILQGLGGGGMPTSEQAILADTFPPAKRGQAFALYGLAVVCAPAIGPTLGGYITDNFDWRWIFFINVPIAAFSLFLTNRIVEDPPHIVAEVKKMRKQGLNLDYVGFALLALGFGSLEFVLDKGQEDDWFGSRLITVFIILCVTSLVTLIGWSLWQIRRKHRPILDLTLFKQRNF